MSHSSDNSCSGNDFDYDAQEKGRVRSGTHVRSGGVTTTSSTNLSSQVNAYPPMTLVEYTNETYDPKKHFCYMQPKYMSPNLVEI